MELIQCQEQFVHRQLCPRFYQWNWKDINNFLCDQIWAMDIKYDFLLPTTNKRKTDIRKTIGYYSKEIKGRIECLSYSFLNKFFKYSVLINASFGKTLRIDKTNSNRIFPSCWRSILQRTKSILNSYNNFYRTMLWSSSYTEKICTMNLIVVLHLISRRGIFIRFFFLITFNEHLKNFHTLNI